MKKILTTLVVTLSAILFLDNCCIQKTYQCTYDVISVETGAVIDTVVTINDYRCDYGQSYSDSTDGLISSRKASLYYRLKTRKVLDCHGEELNE